MGIVQLKKLPKKTTALSVTLERENSISGLIDV